MRTDRTVLILAGLAALATGACQSAPRAASAAAAPAAPAAVAPADVPAPERGLAFAQAHCAACHAIAPGRVSPNPEAPTFAAVVETPGLTAETLSAWLRRSHDFPAIMQFEVASDQIDALTAYMLTQRTAARR